MELGNLAFGNSRGPYEVDRDLVDSVEWQYLIHRLLQVNDYHCVMEEYFTDYNSRNFITRKRTNNLKPTKHGGYVCEYDGEVIFEIFPYWWGDCTCGIDKENEKLRSKWRKELFTDYQWRTYMTFDDYCKRDCPAYLFGENGEENRNKSVDELMKICTCGQVRKNKNLENRKAKIKDKIKEYERREIEELLDHKDSCLLLKHNFVYHPGRQDEVWIDWYKYPFRDSYINKPLSNDEIKFIFKDCAFYLKKVIKANGGRW